MYGDYCIKRTYTCLPVSFAQSVNDIPASIVENRTPRFKPKLPTLAYHFSRVSQNWEGRHWIYNWYLGMVVADGGTRRFIHGLVKQT